MVTIQDTEGTGVGAAATAGITTIGSIGVVSIIGVPGIKSAAVRRSALLLPAVANSLGGDQHPPPLGTRRSVPLSLHPKHTPACRLMYVAEEACP